MKGKKALIILGSITLSLGILSFLFYIIYALVLGYEKVGNLLVIFYVFPLGTLLTIIGILFFIPVIINTIRNKQKNPPVTIEEQKTPQTKHITCRYCGYATPSDLHKCSHCGADL